jgi:type II protein arginine methyltransferase
LTPADTSLVPSDFFAQLICITSPWIDLCSPDPVVADVSRQVLNLEIAYAAFCGVMHVMIPSPKLHRGVDTEGLNTYARAVQEALNTGSYLQIHISLPMIDGSEEEDLIGDLATLRREETPMVSNEVAKKEDVLLGTWDAWNLIRTVCKYSSRLSIALTLPPRLPPQSVVNRWFAEPIRLLFVPATSFLQNNKGYPVLSKAHQALITRYMRLRPPPWIFLSNVGPVPGIADHNDDGGISPGAMADAPTPAESKELAPPKKAKYQDPTPHLSYIRYLQRNQPAKTAIERFGGGYQDYLQAPLQPLTDNLESVTYEVFEKDPVKYDWYERAIALALRDWEDDGKTGSGSDGKVVVAVVGAGRGPLVTRALRAAETSGVDVSVWAVEKNPNAYVLLCDHNEHNWSGAVQVVKSDMRSWKGPYFDHGEAGGESYGSLTSEDGSKGYYGKVDILVSELLGSFGDNELSPECLDGVQHVLNPTHGISIPTSYTAHVTPLSAPKLHGDISSRASMDKEAFETPYVVLLHAVDFISSTPIECTWEFTHPISPSTLAVAESRKGGSIGGGGVCGGDGANEHNSRQYRGIFKCPKRGVCHGLGGYFESVLYQGSNGNAVELSTRPDTIDAKSKDMISWFPIWFPLKVR